MINISIVFDRCYAGHNFATYYFSWPVNGQEIIIIKPKASSIKLGGIAE